MYQYHRLYKSDKEWVWSRWSRYEFWMSLCSYHIRMISNLDYLRQCSIWTCCRNNESFLFHLSAIERIEFESMTMSFCDIQYAIYTLCESSWSDETRITSESHISSFCSEMLLMFHNMNYIMFPIWSEFFTRGICNLEDITSKFNCHNL